MAEVRRIKLRLYLRSALLRLEQFVIQCRAAVLRLRLDSLHRP